MTTAVLALTKNGSGTQILTGANTYSQTTTVNAGVLQIGDGGTTGTLGTGGVTNNATLRFNRSNAISVANAIGGTGALVQAGTGTLTLTNAGNSYTGATTINSGTFEISGGGRLNSGSYAGAISNSGTFLYNSTAAQTLSGALSGTGGLVVANTGALTLSGSSGGFSGPVTVRAGTLQVSSGNGAGTNTITLGDGSTGSSGTTLNAGANFGNAIVVAAGPTGAAAIACRGGHAAPPQRFPCGQPRCLHGRRQRPHDLDRRGRQLERFRQHHRDRRPRHPRHRLREHLVRQHDHQQRGHLPAGQRHHAALGQLGHRQRHAAAQQRQPDHQRALRLRSGARNIVGGNTLTLGAGNATSTFSGVIQNGSGTMTLVKNGTGTFTVTGVNTYTGGTTPVSGNTFEIGGAGSLEFRVPTRATSPTAAS
ncbi:MAG: autotransporter-associated beta strand repeat-containing protein [Kiritimatiellia bacterium]